jgi:hypothetical protein
LFSFSIELTETIVFIAHFFMVRLSNTRLPDFTWLWICACFVYCLYMYMYIITMSDLKFHKSLWYIFLLLTDSKKNLLYCRKWRLVKLDYRTYRNNCFHCTLLHGTTLQHKTPRFHLVVDLYTFMYTDVFMYIVYYSLFHIV